MATPQVSLISAADLDILVYEGDTTPMVITFTNTDDGTPINLSTAVIKIQVKDAPDGTTKQEFSTTDGDIVVSGAGSNIITVSGWGALIKESADFVYDLQVTIGASVKTYLKGKVIVTKDVTV